MNKIDSLRIKIWHLFLPLLLLANLAYLTHNVFGWMVTLGFFLFAPGYLFLKRLLDPSSLGIGKISLSIGLSIAFITVTGLLLNTLHFMVLEKPLQTLYIFIALDSLVLILIALNRTEYINISRQLSRFSLEQRLFIFLFTLLPVLSIFGAIRLNNGASNILTMIMIGLIGVLYVALMIRPTMQRIYPYVIFMTALAVLFALSLRGWSVTGHDIHHEFNVFSKALKLGYWAPQTTGAGDPYNACLSITILPTILAKITGIFPIYIYKVVFQVIFAAIVPTVYEFAKKFGTPKQAIIGTLAFVTFPTFINDLPYLNRQEIAFGYFILILFVNFSNIANRTKSVLTALLLLVIILSHYSTSYVTISVLLLALIVYKVLSLFYRNTSRLNIPLLSLPIIIMAFLATFAWNAQITSSSSNLSSTLTSAKNSILGKDQAVVGSSSLAPNTKKITSPELLSMKAAEVKAEATYSPAELVPLTSLGKKLSNFVDVTVFNNQLHTVVALLLQSFVVLGTGLLFFHFIRKSPTSNEIYLLSACTSFLIALVLFTFVPQLSIGYDVTRLFQQSLTVLWLPVVFFLNTIFIWLGKYKYAASAVVLTLIYFYLSGFGTRLTGGYLPNLSLNNSGLYYDYFYTHKSDEVASRWLGDKSNKRIGYMTVFMDINSASPPLQYSVALGITNGKSQGYYYTDYANNTTGRYRTILSSGFAEYTSPAPTEDKGLIYSNGTSKIYFTWPKYH